MATVTMTHLWLAQDPETGRITAQKREFGDGDFPRGARGRGWPRRDLDVPTEELTKVLNAAYAGEVVDEVHERWWEAAAS